MKSEFSLYETICRYIETTKEKFDLTEADVESLFECTRFFFLSVFLSFFLSLFLSLLSLFS